MATFTAKDFEEKPSFAESDFASPHQFSEEDFKTPSAAEALKPPVDWQSPQLQASIKSGEQNLAAKQAGYEDPGTALTQAIYGPEGIIQKGEALATKPLWSVSKRIGITPQTFANAGDVLQGAADAVSAGMSGGDPGKAYLAAAGQRDRTPTTGENIASGVQNAVAESMDFFTSPVGAATLFAGPLAHLAGKTIPAAAQKAVTGAFVAQMAASAPDQLQAFVDAKKSDDTAGMAKALTGLGLTGAFIGMGAKGLAEGRSRVTEPTEQSGIPDTAQPAPAQNERQIFLSRAELEVGGREGIADTMQKHGLSRDEAIAERTKAKERLGMIHTPADMTSEAAPSPTSASSTPTPPAPASAGGVSSKPEVAKLAEYGSQRAENRLGDPAGTSYHATPADWAEWQRLASRPLMEEGIWPAREAMKNKYGGMPPEAPKAEAKSESISNPELQNLSEMSGGDFVKATDPKTTGLGRTEQSYDYADKITTADIPALEKRESALSAEFKQGMTGDPSVEAVMKLQPINSQKQFINEVIRQRRAQDLVNERGVTDPAELKRIQDDAGSGPLKPATKPPAPAAESPAAPPDRPSAENTPPEVKSLADKIRGWKVEGQEGASFSLPHPDAFKAIGRNALNGALEIMARAVEAGKSIAEAVEAALAHIRANAKGFDEDKVRANLESAFAGETVGDRNVTGLAERVRTERENAGMTAPTEPGQGISPEASVERGWELLKSGADPEKVMSDFEASNRVSADDFAIARAHTERLARATNEAADKFGVDSKEWKAAFKTESDWSARTKKMQTEWAKSGAAQQGEVDIDTGTFTGLARAFKAATGKDFTPGQAETAKRTAKRVTDSEKVSEKANQELNQELDKLSVPKPETQDTSGLTPEKKVWQKVREYLDQGMTSFDEMRSKAATDLGMSVKDVTNLLTKTKKAKRLADEAWRKQQAMRRFREQAKRWLTNTTIPAYQRAIASIPRSLFALKVGFHGTVALGTHAPMVAFQPRFWANYVRDFGKMYKMVGSPAYYERQVQDLLRRPNYTTGRRAGLINDPFQYEDFNNPQVSQYFGRLSGMGNRGYAILKILRQDMFDQHWNQLPKTAQIPEVAQAIADAVNHATGVVKGKAPAGSNVALFAPRLLASRVMWLAADPAKAVDTFARWKTSSEADKIFAINQVKEKAWVAGTMMGLLALNQGMLSATDSKQKVNFTDPFHSDWLKFKAGGMTGSYGNAMITMARLPVRLYKIRSSDGGKLRNLVYPDEDTYTVLGEYARSQASPFASLVSTLWLKGDWQNRPLPNSERPVPKRLRAQGVKPYTWTEFVAEQVAPIPVEEALREVWGHGLGMNADQMKATREAMATIAVMGATGGRLTEDVPYRAPSSSSGGVKYEKSMP